MSVSTEHTHTAAFYWGRSGYFGGKVIGAEVGTFQSRSRRTGIFWRRLSDTHTPRTRRGNGEFLFAHLKCAPVRRALSATDSVCSLLQDGGSTPIHFLLIASQLSLSIRLNTHRFPAEPSGTSPSISSLTNRSRRRALGFSSLCFFLRPAVDVELSTVAAAITDVELRVGLRTTFFPLLFGKRCSPLGYKRQLRVAHTRSCFIYCSATCPYKLVAVWACIASFGFM